MVRALLSCILLCAVCSPALAQEREALLGMSPQVTHLVITLLGMVVAVRMALQAFGRRPVQVANVPTFPRYMTSPQQYRFGSWIFVLFACSFFLLLVHEHREVVAAAAVMEDWIPKNILQAVNDQSDSYLLVIAAMGGVYLYFLSKEAQWNVLLMMRDVIHGWISIPQLAGQIVAQIRFSLRVPQAAIAEVIGNSEGVHEQDFRKARNTPDRLWAEICYMKWWLTQGHNAGEDATFFTEETFGFEQLLSQFEQASWAVGRWKSGAAADLATAQLSETVKELHNRFARLAACYLIYRNGSRKELCAAAAAFGIEVSAVAPENPLRYWIVYVIVLMASVYAGVYASAIFYDALAGKGLHIGQDFDRARDWVMYSIANYGLAIVVILLLRVVGRALGLGFDRTHLITYCWTFAVAFVVGPFGLAVVVHFFGPDTLQSIPLLPLFYQMLKWGLGPALVCVYISYYLDRQTCRDLPDINHSRSTFAWRLLNCFAFAAFTVFVLLPPLLSMNAQEGAVWDSAKLRFVATGTTFFVAFGLALAAQFALRKGTEADNRVLTHQLSA